MTQVLCPVADFKYKFWNEEQEEYWEGDEPLIINEEGNPYTLIEILADDTITLNSSLFERLKDFYLYALDPDGMSIAEEKQLWLQFKSTEVPSKFKTFELYMEDGNGRKATYAIDDAELGILNRVLLSAFVYEEGFNKSFISRIGFHITDCTSDVKTFKLILEKLSLMNSPTPHYCQPQDVIDLLGVRNNDGTPFILDESSSPSYDTVADIICQSENYIEQLTRNCWTERRAVNEIRNTSNSIGVGSPYMGIFQPSVVYSPANAFFRGIACQLVHKNIKDLDADKGDKIEVRWYGDNWRDITESGTVWADNAKGILYIRQFYFQKDVSVRVTYRYGDNMDVPDDIRRAAMLYSAKHILQTANLYRFLFPENPESMDRWRNTAFSFQYEFNDIIAARCEQTIIGGI